MMTGPIIAIFLWLGLIMDVVQSPSDRAAIFSTKRKASVAHSSLDVVMGIVIFFWHGPVISTLPRLTFQS